MQLDRYHNVYFLGIGGIGMSALARWFHYRGARVSGYDATPTPLTAQLEQEGMDIHFEEHPEAIPRSFTPADTLVIYTPAIPAESVELRSLKERRFAIMKRSAALGLITRGYKTVAVAGTHGKTTTSALIAHILKQARVNMVAFLGGITANYATNLLMHGKPDDKDTVILVEADEFDRSFLTLFPDVAVVTSMDADHLDIYGSPEALKRSFGEFVGRITRSGALVVHESLPPFTTEADLYAYGLTRGDFHAKAIRAGRSFVFDVIGPKEKLEKITLSLPGFHNIENAIAAVAVARLLGVSSSVIAKALSSFKGIKRRFEIVVEHDDVVYVDDYAHHPVEIASLLNSLRAMYPQRKITTLFQPHLYSRTRDFADAFAKSLSLSDELLLMDIYPAREKPIPGVSADLIFNAVTHSRKARCNKETVLRELACRDLEVLTTVGAGDIALYVDPIRELIEKKYDDKTL